MMSNSLYPTACSPPYVFKPTNLLNLEPKVNLANIIDAENVFAASMFSNGG